MIIKLAEAASPPSSNTNTILYVMAALLAGGLLDIGWRAYQRYRHGAQDDALEVAKAARDQAQSSTDLWKSYKIELEDAKGQISQYLTELVSVNRELGSALAKISRLDEELRHARGEAQDLKQRLDEAKAHRDELLKRVAELRERIDTLEAQSRLDHPAE